MLLCISKKAGMWGYGPLWFTFADSHPQDITLSEFDELTQDAINNAISQGILLKVDKNGKMLEAPKSQVPAVQRPIISEPTISAPQVSPVIARKLNELLKNGVTTLRREIPQIRGQLVLSAALQLERGNKNRKTVKALLKKMIQKTGSIRMYDDLIKEEEVETVRFDISDIVLESQEENFDIEDSTNRSIKEKVKEL